MSKLYQVALYALTALLLVSGCGVQGTWLSKDVYPCWSDTQFNIVCMTLNADKTYSAIVDEDGKRTRETGSYEYICCKELLILRAPGKERVLTAKKVSGNELRIEKRVPNRGIVTVTMVRKSPCSSCNVYPTRSQSSCPKTGACSQAQPGCSKTAASCSKQAAPCGPKAASSCSQKAAKCGSK